jgi:hypothetical protein
MANCDFQELIGYEEVSKLCWEGLDKLRKEAGLMYPNEVSQNCALFKLIKYYETMPLIKWQSFVSRVTKNE